MTHRHLTVAAALSACAALLLTGCSSDAKSSDEISGAEQAEKTDKPDKPSSTAPGQADRPAIDLPKDLKFVFADSRTDDSEEAAALHDNEQLMKAVDMAISLSDPNHKAYQFYVAGLPATQMRDYIQQFADHKKRTTGTYRFYDRKVTEVKKGSLALSFCADQSKAYNKSLETGEVDVTPVSKDSYVGYRGLMKKSTEGVWVTHELVSTRGVSECQP